MDVLVTGAGGLIGSAVSKRLLQQGFNVTTIDNFSTGFHHNIPKEVTVIEGDVQDREVISKLSQKGFAAILHIAGQSSGEVSFDDPIYDIQTNAQSTLMLLEYARKTGCMEFIYASTMSVYGDSQNQPVSESHPTLPQSFYAIGKLASENYLRLHSLAGMSTTALRLFNVYGPGQNMENLRQGMISIFVAQALETKKIIVKGSAERFRDHVHVDDAAEAFLACLSSPGEKGGNRVINIGSGTKVTVEELLRIISKQFNFEIAVEFNESTLGDMHGIFSDSSLARDILGWQAKIPLEEGIKGMIEWAQNL
jgi:UDP-glucose 4-epimerase